MNKPRRKFLTRLTEKSRERLKEQRESSQESIPGGGCVCGASSVGKSCWKEWSGAFIAIGKFVQGPLRKVFLVWWVTLPSYLPFSHLVMPFMGQQKFYFGAVEGGSVCLYHTPETGHGPPGTWPASWPWWQSLPFSWLINEILYLFHYQICFLAQACFPARPSHITWGTTFTIPIPTDSFHRFGGIPTIPSIPGETQCRPRYPKHNPS